MIEAIDNGCVACGAAGEFFPNLCPDCEREYADYAANHSPKFKANAAGHVVPTRPQSKLQWASNRKRRAA